MSHSLPRRTMVLAGLGLLLALPACEHIPGLGSDQAVRQLLVAASDRAFARLLQENGFAGDQLTRVTLPEELAASGGSEALLLSANRAADAGARAAAPIVSDAIRNLTVADAKSIVRAGPTAATDYLERRAAPTVFEALTPAVGEALRLADAARALPASGAVNFEGLRLEVARRTTDAIFRAIGREEAAIRVNPRAFADIVGSRPALIRLGDGNGPL